MTKPIENTCAVYLAQYQTATGEKLIAHIFGMDLREASASNPRMICACRYAEYTMLNSINGL